MTAEIREENIAGLDDWTALSVIHRSYNNGSRAFDKSLIFRFLNSDDPVIRERAVFIFGIKGKHREYCKDFERMLIDTDHNEYSLISSLLLAICSCDCRINKRLVSAKVLDLLGREAIIDNIGHIVIAFSLNLADRMNKSLFNTYLARMEKPTLMEISAARDALYDLANRG